MINISIFGFDIDPANQESFFAKTSRKESAEIRKYLSETVDERIEALYRNNVKHIETIENASDSMTDAMSAFDSMERFGENISVDGRSFHTIDTETLPILDQITEISITDHSVSVSPSGKQVSTTGSMDFTFGVNDGQYKTLQDLIDKVDSTGWDRLNAAEKSTIERLTMLSGDFNERFEQSFLPDGTPIKAISSYNSTAHKSSTQMAKQGLDNLHLLGLDGQAPKGEKGAKILGHVADKVKNITTTEGSMLTGHNIHSFDLPKLQKMMKEVKIDLDIPNEKYFDLLTALKTSFDGDEERLTEFLNEIAQEKTGYASGAKTMDQFRHALKKNTKDAHMARVDNEFFAELLFTSDDNGNTFFDFINDKMNEKKANVSSFKKGDTVMANRSSLGGLLDYTLDKDGELVDYLDWPVSRNKSYTIDSISEIDFDTIQKAIGEKASPEELKKISQEIKDYYKITEMDNLILTTLKDSDGNTSYLYRNNGNPLVDGMSEGSDKGRESARKFFQNHFSNVSDMSSEEIASFNQLTKEDKVRRSFEGFFQPANLDINKGFSEADRMYSTINAFEGLKKTKGLDVSTGDFVETLKQSEPETYNSLISNLSKHPGISPHKSTEDKFYMLRNVLSDTNDSIGENVRLINEGVEASQIGLDAHHMNLYKTELLRRERDAAISDMKKYYSGFSKVEIDGEIIEMTDELAGKIASNRTRKATAFNELTSINIPDGSGGFSSINLKDNSSINQSLYGLYGKSKSGLRDTTGSNYFALNKMVDDLKSNGLGIVPSDFNVNNEMSVHENITRLGLTIKNNATPEQAGLKSLTDNLKFNMDGYDSFLESDGVLIKSNKGNIMGMGNNPNRIKNNIDELGGVFPNMFVSKKQHMYYNKGFAPGLPKEMEDFLRKETGWNTEAIDNLGKGLFNTKSKHGPMGWLTRPGVDGENHITMGMFKDDDGHLFMAFGDERYESKNLYETIINKDPSRASKGVAVIEMPTIEKINGTEVVSYKGYKKQNIGKVKTYVSKGATHIKYEDSVSEAVNAYFAHSVSLTNQVTPLENLMDGRGDKAASSIDRYIMSSLESSADIKGVSSVLTDSGVTKMTIPNAVDAQKTIDFQDFVLRGLKDVASLEETPEEFRHLFEEIDRRSSDRFITKDKLANLTESEMKNFKDFDTKMLNLNQQSIILENMIIDTDPNAKGNMGVVEKLLDFYKKGAQEYDLETINKIEDIVSEGLSQGQSATDTVKGRLSVGHIAEMQPFGFLTGQNRQSARQQAEGAMLPMSDLVDFSAARPDAKDFVFIDKVLTTDREQRFLGQVSSTENILKLKQQVPSSHVEGGFTNGISVLTKQMNDEQIHTNLQSFRRNVLDRLNAEDAVETAKRILNKAGIQTGEGLTNENIELLEEMFEKVAFVSTTHEQHKFGPTALFDERAFGRPEINSEKIATNLTDEEAQSLIGKFFAGGERVSAGDVDTGALNNGYFGQVTEVRDGKVFFGHVENPEFSAKISSDISSEQTEFNLQNLTNKELDDTISRLESKMETVKTEEILEEHSRAQAERQARDSVVGRKLMPGETVDVNGRKLSIDNIEGAPDSKLMSQGITIQGIDGNTINVKSEINSRYLNEIKVHAGGVEKGIVSTWSTGDSLKDAVGDELFQEIYGDGRRVGMISNDNIYKHDGRGLIVSSNIEKIMRTSPEDGQTLHRALIERLGDDVILSDGDGQIVVSGNPSANKRWDETLSGIFKEFEEGEVNVGGQKVAVSPETSQFLKDTDYSIQSLSKANISEKRSAIGDTGRGFGKGNLIGAREASINMMNIDVNNLEDWDKVFQANKDINDYLFGDTFIDTADNVNLKTMESEKVYRAKRTMGAYSKAILNSGRVDEELVDGLTELSEGLKVTSMNIDEAVKLTPRGTIGVNDMDSTLFSSKYGDILEIDLGELSIDSPLPARKGSLNLSTNKIYIPNIPLGRAGEEAQYNQFQSKVVNLLDNIEAYRRNDRSLDEAQEALTRLTQNLYKQYQEDLTKKHGFIERLYSKRAPNSGSNLLKIMSPDFSLEMKDGTIIEGMQEVMETLSTNEQGIENITHRNPVMDKTLKRIGLIEKTDSGFLFKDGKLASLKSLEERGVGVGYGSRRALEDAVTDSSILSKMRVGSIEELSQMSEYDRGVRYLENVGVRGVDFRHPNFKDTSTNKMATYLDRNIDSNAVVIMPYTAKKVNADVDGDTFFDIVIKNKSLEGPIDTVINKEAVRNKEFLLESMKDLDKLGTVTADFEEMRKFSVVKIADRDIPEGSPLKGGVIDRIQNLKLNEINSVYDGADIDGITSDTLDEALSLIDDLNETQGHKLTSASSIRGGVQADFKKKKGVGYASIPNFKIRDVAVEALMDGKQDNEALLSRIVEFTDLTEEGIISSKHVGFSDKPHWADNYSSMLSKITSLKSSEEEITEGLGQLRNVVLEASGDEDKTDELVGAIQELFHGEQGIENRKRFNDKALALRNSYGYEDFGEVAQVLTTPNVDATPGTVEHGLNVSRRKLKEPSKINYPSRGLYSDGLDFMSPSSRGVQVNEDGFFQMDWDIQRIIKDGDGYRAIDTGDVFSIRATTGSDLSNQISDMGLIKFNKTTDALKFADISLESAFDSVSSIEEIQSINNALNTNPGSKGEFLDWGQLGFRDQQRLKGMTAFSEDLRALEDASYITKEQSGNIIRDMNSKLKARASEATGYKERQSFIDEAILENRSKLLNQYSDLTVANQDSYSGLINQANTVKPQNTNLIDMFNSQKELDVDGLRSSLVNRNNVELEKLRNLNAGSLEELGGLEFLERQLTQENVSENVDAIKRMNEGIITKKNDIMREMVGKVDSDESIREFMNWRSYSDLRNMSRDDLGILDDMMVTYGSRTGQRFKDLSMGDFNELLSIKSNDVPEGSIDLLNDMKKKANLYMNHKSSKDALNEIRENVSKRTFKDVSLDNLDINFNRAEDYMSKIGQDAAGKFEKQAREGFSDTLSSSASNASRSGIGKGLLAVGLAVAAYSLGKNIAGSGAPLTPEKVKGSGGATPRIDGTYDDEEKQRSANPFKKTVVLEDLAGVNVNVSGTAPDNYDQVSAQNAMQQSGVSGDINLSFQDKRGNISENWLEQKISSLF